MTAGDAGGPEGLKPAPTLAGSASPGHQRRPIWLAALVAIVVFLAVFGLWNRKSHEAGQSKAADSPGEFLRAATAEGTPLAAVGRTAGLESACTAWLLDTGAQGAAQAHAVTTSRCVGATDPATVVSGRQLSGATVAFHAFAPQTATSAPELVEVPIETVEWASVRGTDLAVLRLGSTNADLADQGIRPIRPVAAPVEGAEILVAGVPVEDISSNEQYLRGSRCQAGGTMDVLEGPLLWRDLNSSDCRGILDGSQGSAVFNEAGEAVGMVNTSTIGAEDGPDCLLGRPCEVSSSGRLTFAKDRSYMVPVQALAACFVAGEFTVGGRCSLEDPVSVVGARPAASVARPGSTIVVKVTDSDGGTRIQTKLGMLGEVDCSDPQDWATAEQPYQVTLPKEEGFALVCVGSAEQATQIVVRLDGSAPDRASIELIQTPVQGGVRVEPVLDPPDLVAFRWVSGPRGAIDCAAAEGYVLYRGGSALIQASDLPSTVCVIGIDAAGNESKPSAHNVG